jgi:hypothetical protein
MNKERLKIERELANAVKLASKQRVLNLIKEVKRSNDYELREAVFRERNVYENKQNKALKKYYEKLELLERGGLA